MHTITVKCPAALRWLCCAAAMAGALSLATAAWAEAATPTDAPVPTPYDDDAGDEPDAEPAPEVDVPEEPAAEPEEPEAEPAAEPEALAEPVEEPVTEPEPPEVEPEVDEPAPRTSGPPHCHGQHLEAWTLEEIVATRYNNFGLANGLRASRCWPLFTDRDRDGIMFALSNFEIGLVNWLAPVFAYLGVFASFTPISLLTVGVEVTGFGVWPSTLTTTGHIAMDGYDDRFDSSGLIQDVPEDDLESAIGVNVNLNATVRGRVRLGEYSRGTIYLIMADTLNIEYWRQGTDDYYWNLRIDAVMQQSDWIMSNRLVALVSLPLTDVHSLRFGLYDELLYSIGDTDLQRHQVGALVGVNVSRLGNRIRGFETVLVVTGMTHVVRTMREFPPLNIMLKVTIPFVWPLS